MIPKENTKYPQGLEEHQIYLLQSRLDRKLLIKKIKLICKFLRYLRTHSFVSMDDPAQPPIEVLCKDPTEQVLNRYFSPLCCRTSLQGEYSDHSDHLAVRRIKISLN